MVRISPWGCAAVIAASVFVNGLLGQEPAKVAAAAGDELAKGVDLVFARVVTKEVPVQCFATDRSPFFEDRLREGDVVKVEPTAGAYHRLQLPMGVIGYVHRSFCAAPEKGIVRTQRPKVSFRYRAKSGEAPHSLLPKDTALFCLGAEGDWYRVRQVGARAYVPVKDVQVFETPNPTLEKSAAAMEELHRKEWLAVTGAFEEHESLRKEHELKVRTLGEFRKRLLAITSNRAAAPLVRRDELKKLHGEVADLAKKLDVHGVDPKNADVKAVGVRAVPAAAKKDTVGGLGLANKRAALLQEARILGVDVQGQIRLAEAVAALQRRPRPATDVVVKKPDPGPSRSERFDAVGWLRFDRRAAGVNRFRLEKGRRLVAYLRTTATRYDLRNFDGVEVAVRGTRSTGGSPAAPLIDVTRMEVLAVDR